MDRYAVNWGCRPVYSIHRVETRSAFYRATVPLPVSIFLFFSLSLSAVGSAHTFFFFFFFHGALHAEVIIDSLVLG